MDEVMKTIGDSLRFYAKRPMKYQGGRRIDFESSCYTRSALIELRRYLLKNYDRDPLLVVEEFRDKVDQFACKTRSGTANFMFSTYYDVATDIIDRMIGTP